MKIIENPILFWSPLINLKIFALVEASNIAEILDGQHRIEGIRLASKKPEEMIVVIMLNATEEEKAYIFSTINSNQRKVDKSLIYDLFELSPERSPYKTCHELARLMNSSEDSPFYNRLKMLGRKESKAQILTQGSFVNTIVNLISGNPNEDRIKLKNKENIEDNKNYVLRNLFINKMDATIYKILKNYFEAIKCVFPEEWENSDQTYILIKTTGFNAVIKAFPDIFHFGIDQKTLKVDFFIKALMMVKKKLNIDGKSLTADNFSSNAAGQKDLTKYFLEGFKEYKESFNIPEK